MNQARMAAKVRKLLALAQSSNPHEAALAAERAGQIMLEWELTERDLTPANAGELEASRTITEWTLEPGHGRRVLWRGQLANAAAVLFGCRFYFRRSDLQIVGTTDRADMVEATYHYLVDTVERLAEEGWRQLEAQLGGAAKAIDVFEAVHGGGGDRARWVDSFKAGAAIEIGLKADEFRVRRQRTLNGTVRHPTEAPSATSTALARLEEDVDAYLDRLCPSSAAPTAATIHDPEAAYAGRRAGRRVDFGAAPLTSAARKLKG